MTDELLDRVRASDPLPQGSTAPSYPAVLAHVRAEGSRSRPRRSGRVLAAALTCAGALVAVIVSVVILGTHHQGTARPAHRPIVTRPLTVVPRSGMSGLVYFQGAGFSSPDSLVISLQQCLGCRKGNPTAHARFLYWLLATADAGRTWRLSAQHYYIQQPVFAGADGWAGGAQAVGHGGGGIARYYVTHDAGRSWRIAPAAAPNQGGALVSLGGGEVWATGLSTRVAILHAPVGGHRLTATATQPIAGNWTNVSVTAGGPGTAYVTNGNADRQRFVTHDDGRTWQRMASPCQTGRLAQVLAAFGETVWANCFPARGGNGPALVRSDDAGRHWRPVATPAGGNFLHLQAASSPVAWASTFSGRVMRTADGGQTWHTVWSQSNRRDAPIRAQVPRLGPWASFPGTPTLVAQGPSSATVLVVITRGRAAGQAKTTNLVLYRTTDAGQTWRAQVVPLATR